ncbi:MAG: alpha/beta hydrolase [Pseudomonadota bacterium]
MLHHRIIGRGAPIVLLHGVTLDLRHMMDVMEPGFRAANGVQRIYVDMPGHGHSAPSAGIKSQDDLLAAVLEFIEQDLQLDRFAIAGLSRGSYIARGVLHHMPKRVTGAALIVPGGNPSADPARLPPVEVIDADPRIAEHLRDDEMWAHENLSVVQSWAIAEKRRQIIQPARALFDSEQEARVFANFEFSFADDEAQAIFDKPSLIVAGRQDSMSGYLDSMDLMHRFPRATLAILDTAGHGVGWERPDLFASLVRDWVVRMGLA